MKILICNAGSTSLKFKLWQMPEFTCMASGRVERVGSENAIFQYASGDYSVRREPIPIPDYECGIRLFLNELVRGERDRQTMYHEILNTMAALGGEADVR